MNDEQEQADLLEQYLNALAHDAEALPPAGLDAETAAFARMMAQQASPPQVEPNLRDQLWTQTLAQAQGRSNGHRHSRPYTDYDHQWESHPMTAIPIEQDSKRSMLPLTLVAALATLIMIGTLLLTAQQMSGPEPDTASALLQGETETATPIPTAVFTATPFVPTIIPTVPPPADMSGGGGGGGGGSASMPGNVISIEDLLMQYPPTAVELGEVYQGSVNSDHPYLTFSYVAPEDMMLVVLVDTYGYAAQVATSVRSQPVEGPFGGGGGGGGGGGPLRSPQLIELRAGDSLNYLVYIRDQALPGAGFSYRARFEALQPSPVDPGSEISGTIDADTPYQAYSFEVQAGDVFSVSSVMPGDDSLDTRLTLRSANHRQYAEDDDGGQGFNPEIYNQMSVIDDTIVVMVAPAISGQTGDFSLAVDLNPAPVFESGTIQLTSKRPDYILRLNGEPGTTQALRLSPALPNHGLRVEVSDGATVLNSAQSENVREMVVDVTFPDSGEVIVSIAEFTQRSSGFDFSLDVAVALDEPAS